MFRHSALLLLALAFATSGHAQQLNLNSVSIPTNSPAANAPVINAFSPTAASSKTSTDVVVLLHQAYELLQQKQNDAALDKVNQVIQISPKNLDAFGIRGGIYAAKKQWDLAGKDYLTVLQIDATNTQAKFNLGEIQFMQKKYDVARTSFDTLKHDRDLGDLAAYKVFLCDLLGGHDDIAATELAAFDTVAPGPSFYFGKAAWCLYHKQTEDARSWLQSAAGIYLPQKFKLYAASLFDLGYLPLPAPPQKS